MDLAAQNQRLLKKLLLLTLAMFGFGFALIPFYKTLCEVAGINQLIKADAAPVNTQIDSSRELTLELDANLRDGLPWRFKPLRAASRCIRGRWCGSTTSWKTCPAGQ